MVPGSSAATNATCPTAAASPAPSAPVAIAQVYTGQVVQTRFGDIQVQITVLGTQITDVQALQLPNDRHYSAQISDYVEPYLRQMALQAQSAQIDLISGATYTSEGYARRSSRPSTRSPRPSSARVPPAASAQSPTAHDRMHGLGR